MARAKAESRLDSKQSREFYGPDYAELAPRGAGSVVLVKTVAMVLRPVVPGLKNPIYQAELEVGSELEITLMEADYPRGCAELEQGRELRLHDGSGMPCCDTEPAYGVCLVGLPILRPSGVEGSLSGQPERSPERHAKRMPPNN